MLRSLPEKILQAIYRQVFTRIFIHFLYIYYTTLEKLLVYIWFPLFFRDRIHVIHKKHWLHKKCFCLFLCHFMAIESLIFFIRIFVRLLVLLFVQLDSVQYCVVIADYVARE